MAPFMYFKIKLSIKKVNLKNALNVLQNKYPETPCQNLQDIVNNFGLCFAENVVDTGDMLECEGFLTEIEEGEQKKVLQLLAPYLEDSYLHGINGDGQLFKYTIKSQVFVDILLNYV